MFSNNKFYFRHLGGSVGLANRMGKSPQHSSFLVVLFIGLLYVILCGENKTKQSKTKPVHIPVSQLVPALNISP